MQPMGSASRYSLCGEGGDGSWRGRWGPLRAHLAALIARGPAAPPTRASTSPAEAGAPRAGVSCLSPQGLAWPPMGEVVLERKTTPRSSQQEQTKRSRPPPHAPGTTKTQ